MILDRQAMEAGAGHGDADRIGSVEPAVKQVPAADEGHDPGRGREPFAGDGALEAAGSVELKHVMVGTGIDTSAIPLKPLGREQGAMCDEVVNRIRDVGAEGQDGGSRRRTDLVHRRQKRAPPLEGLAGR